jgi:hypothetical protein
MKLTAYVSQSNDIILDYMMPYQEPDQVWVIPTVEQFCKYYDRDLILGSEGDALDELDTIMCRDGEILGYQIM